MRIENGGGGGDGRGCICYIELSVGGLLSCETWLISEGTARKIYAVYPLLEICILCIAPSVFLQESIQEYILSLQHNATISQEPSKQCNNLTGVYNTT